jgi:hypothetical protein
MQGLFQIKIKYTCSLHQNFRMPMKRSFLLDVTLLILFILIILIWPKHIIGQVFTYEGAESTLQSAIYSVIVEQADKSYNSFVYEDPNQFTSFKHNMTDWNHWTCFSFSDTVKITVQLISGSSIDGCVIYPLKDSIIPRIIGNTVSFTIYEPVKIHVAIDGMYEHPLFIFADPPETDIPSPNDPNVVYWGPGIHEIGEHFPAESNMTYYLAGGAYVKGSILGVQDATNVTIRGRGILSGIDIEHCGYRECRFEKTAINLPGDSRKEFFIEGITITNPGQYCIQSYGGKLTTTNIKAFGWWYETDGWVGGNGSVLTNSFFKVHDDIVKLYFGNLTISDLVIYKQHNGAPFQFGWGSERGNNSTIKNIDIITDESFALYNNKSMINTANGNHTNTVNNIHFSNIRADQNLSNIFGMRSDGTYNDIIIENLTVRGNTKFHNYIRGKGVFNNIVLKNIEINGNCISSIEDAGGLVIHDPGIEYDVRVIPCFDP